METLFTPEKHDDWRNAYITNNPFALFPDYMMGQARFNSPLYLFLSSVSRGVVHPDVLKWAPRDHTAGGTIGPSRNDLRQEGVITFVMASLLRKYQTAEHWDNVVFPRLKVMADLMLSHCRAGDMDECLGYLAYWLLMDTVHGTKYMDAVKGPALGEPYYVGLEDDANEPWQVESYVRFSVMTDEKVTGGFWDASTDYFFNTACIWMLGGAALNSLGVELPNFNKWISELREYLLYSVAHDGSFDEIHGDRWSGETLHMPLRLNLMWGLVGLGADPTGEIAAYASALRPVTSVENLYPAPAGMGWDYWSFLLATPSQMLVAPKVPDPGTGAITGAGFALHRGVESSCHIHWHNLIYDDHSYWGVRHNVRWGIRGAMVLDSPARWNVDQNAHYENNSVAMKGEPWFWNSVLDSITKTPTGFMILGSTFGPHQRHYYSANTYSAPDAYSGCRITFAADYDESSGSITWGFKWTSPGDNFPPWFADRNVFEFLLHSQSEMELIPGGARWKVFREDVELQVSGTGVVVEVTKPLSGWSRATISSNSLNGEMIVTVKSKQGALPAGLAESLEFENHVWSLGGSGTGGFAALLDGQHVGNGYVIGYRLHEGRVIMMNNQGSWFHWDGASWQSVPAPPLVDPVPDPEPEPEPDPVASGVFVSEDGKTEYRISETAIEIWKQVSMENVVPKGGVS